MKTASIRLTDSERAVLHHFVYVTRRPEEIGAELGLPTSSVRGMLHRFCNFEVPRALRLVIEATPEPEPEPVLEHIEAPPADTTVGADDLITIGLTYRQVDYWTRAGYLHVLGDPNPGNGVKRAWPLAELDIARLTLRLIDAGLDLEVAARAARDGEHQLGPGIRLVVEDVPGLVRVRPVRQKTSVAQRCADKHTHTPDQPANPVEWVEWAERKAQTHTQTRCPTCRQWAIWTPKETP